MSEAIVSVTKTARPQVLDFDRSTLQNATKNIPLSDAHNSHHHQTKSPEISTPTLKPLIQPAPHEALSKPAKSGVELGASPKAKTGLSLLPWGRTRWAGIFQKIHQDAEALMKNFRHTSRLLTPDASTRKRLLQILAQEATNPDPTTPRSDAEVWTSVGLNVDTSDGIDEAELTELAFLASTAPAEFVRRLREDSMNGTSIDYERTVVSEFGEVSTKLGIDQGELHSTVALQLLEGLPFGRADNSPKAEQKNEALVVALNTRATLEENGDLSGIKLGVELKNIPPFEVADLSGERETLEALEEANTIENPDARLKRLRSIHDTIYSGLEGILVQAFADFVDEGESVNLTIEAEDYETKIKAKLGGGAFDISADRLIDDVTVNVRGNIAGHTEQSGDIIAIDRAGLDIAESLGVRVPETGGLEDMVITADGKPVPFDEVTLLVLSALVALSMSGELDI